MLTTAVKQVGRVVPGDHLCLPYGCDAELRAVLATFIVDGLSHGEKVLYVSDTALPEAMTLWLRSLNIDSGPAYARGQLELRAARELLAPRGRFDVGSAVDAVATETAKAASAGYRGLRIMTEMSWALGNVAGPDRVVEFERRVQAAYEGRGLTGVCQYDRRLFPPRDLERHAGAHRMLVEPDAVLETPELRVTRTFAPCGLRVTGTVDRGTCGELGSVLEKWLISEPGDIQLDMAGLHFIDVAGLRLLVEYARSLEDRSLRLRNLAPMLRQVIGIVGWSDTPNLVLVDDEPVTA